MLSDLNQTVENLIRSGLSYSNQIEISFELPNREWSGSASAATANKPTINVYLYNIHENVDLRATQWQTRPDRPGLNGGTTPALRRVRPGRRYDVHYLLTAWAGEVNQTHKLLWDVLKVFLVYEELAINQLSGELVNQPQPVPLRVGQRENPMQSIADVWSALDNTLRPSLTLVLTIAMEEQELRSFQPLYPVRASQLVEGSQLPLNLSFGGFIDLNPRPAPPGPEPFWPGTRPEGAAETEERRVWETRQTRYREWLVNSNTYTNWQKTRIKITLLRRNEPVNGFVQETYAVYDNRYDYWRYQFRNIPEGSYLVRVEAPGWSNTAQEKKIEIAPPTQVEGQTRIEFNYNFVVDKEEEITPTN